MTAVQQVPCTVLFLGEFLGTAILMYIGCMGCVVEFQGGPILPAFAFGFAILAAVQIVGHITGCHMNPAISLGILILGKINWKDCIIYFLGQYLGALAGYAALKVMMSSEYNTICVLKLDNGVNFIQGLFIEIVVTGILMFVVAGSMDEKNKNKSDSASLRIGLTVAGFIFAAVTSLRARILQAAQEIPLAEVVQPRNQSFADVNFALKMTVDISSSF
ncbi:hypothetical protein NQ318_005606 [Aromia moschata]|uniref:Aquaporin n=1 Tax=Aromia moschata TaxID=1265417 RepID=A0AAV8XV30_9CUCU|nr:hypothetical protein NQ318_005606 [Aromia moschata]